jgi:anti-sigma factor RsiW
MKVDCRDIQPLFGAYLDGELTEREIEDIDSHGETCADCAQALREEAVFLTRIKKELATPPAPEDFKKRLAQKLDGVDREVKTAVRRQRIAWALPGGSALAAAAALVLFVVSKTSGIGGMQSASITQDVVTQRFEQPAPVVRTGSRPELTRVAQDQVHIPIRPPRFAHSGVELKGIYTSNVQGRNAAVFVYDFVRGGKHSAVYMYAFDARGLDFRTSESRILDGRELFLSEIRGMGTVSYKDEQQVGYVFMSDMSPNELEELVRHSDLLLLFNPPASGESALP